ncbi:metallophosphoesterase family protein [Spirochaetota bacterium]
MRYAVISDIHSNLTALDAVLEDARPFDALLCLGDVVGYGPDPNECVARLQSYPLTCIAGNHDLAAIGQLDLSRFNPDARQANYWTRDELRRESRDFLLNLPNTIKLGGFLLAHGSPVNPVWEYLDSLYLAKDNFLRFDFQTAFVGHTHIALAIKWDSEQKEASFPEENACSLSLAKDRLILNPGSVGQPRDDDPRASYAIMDTEKMSWEFRRTHYNIERTQKRMRNCGLPKRLIERLQYGW